jgi:RNA polymerase sigma-70 factor (ECF subfamily)
VVQRQSTTGKRDNGIISMFSNTKFIRNELEKHRDLLYRIAYSWCHDPSLADDLAQEALLKALRNAKQLKDTDAIKGWLSKILANCWYDYLRRKKETVDLDSLPYEENVNEIDSNERQDIVDRVRAMIALLPIGQRQVITLVDLAGFSYAEISGILDIPIGTVMSRICRARKALKITLAEYDPRHEFVRARLRSVK